MLSAALETDLWKGTDAFETDFFEPAFVAESRIGNNATNGTHELDLGDNTAAPAVTKQYVWANSIEYGFTVQYTPSPTDANRGTVVFTTTKPASAPVSLTYDLQADWEATDGDAIFVRVRAAKPNALMSITDMQLTAPDLGAAPVAVPAPPGPADANFPAGGVRTAFDPARNTLQITGADLQAGFTLTGNSHWTFAASGANKPANSALAFQVKVGTVPTVDLDVDSDNTSAFALPDRNRAEDDIEDDTDKPGKLIVANDDDGDSDGIPDFADGFNYDAIAGNADDTPAFAAQGELFVPVVLAIDPKISLSAAKLRLTYPASDPRPFDAAARPDGLMREGMGTEADRFRYTAGAGFLRLWTNGGNFSRTSRDFTLAQAGEEYLGFYVPPTPADGWYNPADLEMLGFGGVNNVREVTMYVECVRPDTTLANQRILVEVDGDGDDSFDAHIRDAVRFTSTQVAVVYDVVANGLRTVDATDPVAGFTRIGHWGEDVSPWASLPGGPLDGLNGYYGPEAFADANDNDRWDPGEAFTDEMRNGAMNGIYDIETVRNEVGAAGNDWNNFIDRDPERFYVRVVDASANLDPMVAETSIAYISTRDDDDNPDDLSTRVTLRETDVDTGVFVSESQLLTAPDLAGVNPTEQDDGFQVVSAITGSAVADEANNDRTHKATVDGAVEVVYGPLPDKRFTPVSRCDVDERRVLNIRAHVFLEPYSDFGADGIAGTGDAGEGNGAFDAGEPYREISGDGVRNTVLGAKDATITFVNANVDRANTAWAQAGIRVRLAEPLRFEDPPNLPDGTNVFADDTFSMDRALGVTEDEETIIGNVAGVQPGVLEAFFVPAFSDANPAWGAASAPSLRGDDGVGAGDQENTYVFVSAISDINGRVLAHEIWHALTREEDRFRPAHLFAPSRYPLPSDERVTQFRRITHSIERIARTYRAAGDLTAGGNRLLREVV